MKLLRDVLRETPPGYTPVALFMTDGVCYGDGAKDEFQSVMNEYKDTGQVVCFMVQKLRTAWAPEPPHSIT